MIQRQPTFKFDLTHPSPQHKVFQRLGEKQATDIIVQILNGGQPFSLTGIRFGFEMRNDAGKIIIDENQTKFSVIDNAKGIFRYRVDDAGFSYFGNSYLAYFTLKISDVRITTERFRFQNDEDVQQGSTGLQEHYVSVIDDLVKSNAEAIAKAQEIKAMIEANQVVKKTGDTIEGPIRFDVPFTVRGSGATFDMRPQVSGVYQKGIRHTINTTNNFYAFAPIDDQGNANWTNQMALYGDTGVLDIKDINIRGGSGSNVITKANNGKANLTLTADATNKNEAVPPLAVRRGSSVTLRLAILRVASSTNSLVTTLPSTMRPTDTWVYNVLADDGSRVSLEIRPNGQIHVYTAGKGFSFTETFVVD
ncbi:BppU family phage baseplate upper protein [Bacillus thuringiensis]|uniref:BppU N-terminal domain-containing protein n=1 Tax=Bacillus thuringiensis HD-771 TaxID=1218175 RepID=A0A9W3NW73_BACTU|nr:BppU family phage baseplate upper protein [Bacillus thuringiensis]AFQ14615.1 hypothetical protein BTG_05615 [Bacillus thuringiensis HD-771]MEC3267440.1 BppU family phage baseplate upper protein [Bacillus thuringiensis]MEC3516179.1 BppU family phage baseplate upper protein [Bacillus thuringiensis]MED2072276.1 BppU family phage baseplate upper protein [Bacillus thuringiensis]MED2223403.1 BppU family phage baseplate upper protein [Bacillus thuringiensis]